MTNIIFSQHAIIQLKIRRITQAEVRLALISPDKTIKQTNERFQSVKRIGQRYLLITIYDRTNNHLEIITSFKTSKITKYL